MSTAITITDPAIGTTASHPNPFDAAARPASMMRAAPGTGRVACSHSPQRRQASSAAGASSAATAETAATQFDPDDGADTGDVLP